MNYLNYGYYECITYLSTHTVYLYKIHFLWPYLKMDTGKHNFHEILLVFSTEQKD